MPATKFPTGVSIGMPVSVSKTSRPSYPNAKCLSDRLLGVENMDFNYSLAGCASLCTQKNVEQKCNCSTVTQLRNDPNNPGACLKITNDNLTETFDRVRCESRASLEAAHGDPAKDCHCILPCKEYEYNTKTFLTNWPSKSTTLDFVKRFIMPAKLNETFVNEVGQIPKELLASYGAVPVRDGMFVSVVVVLLFFSFFFSFFAECG